MPVDDDKEPPTDPHGHAPPTEPPDGAIAGAPAWANILDSRQRRRHMELSAAFHDAGERIVERVERIIAEVRTELQEAVRRVRAEVEDIAKDATQDRSRLDAVEARLEELERRVAQLGAP